MLTKAKLIELIESGALDAYLSSSMSDQDILDAIRRKDGSGSEIDADMLDGKQGSEYALSTAVNQLSNSNIIINPGFQVWKSGESFSSVGVSKYTADRWVGTGNLSANVSKHAYGMYREATSAGVGFGINQRIEMSQQYAHKLINTPMMLSYCLRTGSAARTLQGQNFPAFTDTVQTVALTFTQTDYDYVMANGWSNFLTGKIGVSSLADGSQIPIGFWCIFRWVKLELGSIATPFVSRRYDEELESCQRTLLKVCGDPLGSGYINAGGTSAYIIVPTPVTMRVAPAFDKLASDFRIRTGGTDVAPTAVNVYAIKDNMIVLQMPASGLTARQQATAYCTSGDILFSAEL